MCVKLVTMWKQFIVFCFSLVLVNVINAQKSQLIIKGSDKDLHLDHIVSPKEGIFSIGRLYNVHPKAIAAYNKLDMSKGLSLGQVIHIPLTDTNFSQKNMNGKPIYYTTGDKETLEKVSNVNHRVPLQNLRDWNKLTDDKITAGKKLIIGFLVTNENATGTVPPEKKEVVGRDTATKSPIAKTNIEQEKTVIKEEEKKVIKEEEKKEEPKKTAPVATRPQVTTERNGQGYFKSSFDQQIRTNPLSKTETVTAGIFKMTNSPQEAKYYMLIDGIPSGTIVRVINPDNNKAIYAKVLGEMSGIRQNQGLTIRISNAAASTLDITDNDKFIVKINY